MERMRQVDNLMNPKILTHPHPHHQKLLIRKKQQVSQRKEITRTPQQHHLNVQNKVQYLQTAQ
jgi:hypothetical protein